MRRVHRVLKKVNIVRIACDQMFGEQHTHRHRMTVGVVFMCIGVSIAKGATYFEYEIIRFIGDGLGYLIHGLGGVPFADFLMERARLNAAASAQAQEKKDDESV